jgi:hypothetical protein
MQLTALLRLGRDAQVGRLYINPIHVQFAQWNNQIRHLYIIRTSLVETPNLGVSNRHTIADLAGIRALRAGGRGTE